MWELEAKVDGKTFACKSVITFCCFFVFCSSLSADLFSGKKKFWHGNQLLEFFPCSYALMQKRKKLLPNLGYIFVFLQKWIATREKFEKLITVGQFCFFSISRRIDPRPRMSRKQKSTNFWWPTCTQRIFHLLLPLALTILKKLFGTFLKILGFKKSFTKLLLHWKAYNFRIFYYWKSNDESKSIECFNALITIIFIMFYYRLIYLCPVI